MPATGTAATAVDAVDSQVLSQVSAWLEQGKDCWLATVIETWGSSPRPVGSLLACDAAGHLVGSLSGGCVEDDLLEKLQAGELAATAPQFFTYGVTTEETERLGLPCGGHLNIVVEPQHGDAQTIAHFAHLNQRLQQRQCVLRTVDLRQRTAHARDVETNAPLLWDDQSQVLQHTLGPQAQLFIIGAGMVSQYLAQMALTLDFAVTVCDPREQLLDDFPVPGVNRVRDMPDDAVKAHATDRQSAIVALTHDPRIDDMGLMQALETEAFYIGAMGSSRTSASRRERLLALDVSAADLAKLRAPIGLPIGSKTPPEIAVAILAEIIAVRKSAAVSATDAALAAATPG